MNDQEMHDLKNTLRKLEIMAELLRKKDFSVFSEPEILSDAAQEIAFLQRLFSHPQ